jgi:hypothetical protein
MVEGLGTARLVSRPARERTTADRIRRPRGRAHCAFPMQCLHRASAEILAVGEPAPLDRPPRISVRISSSTRRISAIGSARGYCPAER